MKWWAFQIVVGWVICTPLLLTADEPSSTKNQTIAPKSDPVHHWVGMSGCSKINCHNGSTKGANRQFGLWTTDNHASAFDVLTDSRSQRIAQAVGLSSPAHESKLCLKCHSANAVSMPPSDKVRLSEGASCEVCHGPASNWVGPHLSREWRAQPKSVKSQFGLRDLSSPRERVETCIKCHVGTPGFEVTHEMIAAGHPRMLFEMTAFLAAMPQHWDEAKIRRRVPQFAAKVWLIGQTATLRRTIDNIEARSSDQVFPEFADHDCYACHRSLTGHSTGKPFGANSRTWGRWPAELTLLAEKRSFGLPTGTIEAVSDLRDQLRLTQIDRSAMQVHALSQKLAAWDAFADQTEWTPTQLRAVMLECTAPIAPGHSDWEVTWQRSQALTALLQSWSSGNEILTKQLATSLAALKAERNMPKGFDSPKSFDLESVNRHLKVMRQALATSP